MQDYFLRNLAELAEKRAMGMRQEAQLWDILSRDLKREAGRREGIEPRIKAPLLPQRAPEENEFDKQRLFVRISDAIKIMGISRSSLYSEITKGHLKVKKCGRKTLIAMKDIEAWSEKLAEGVSR